ncbi:MAG: sigma-54 dependent transcriptional regulator [Gemmatimonadetes bacterium]|nr:sigma-54 dependent transcriptional regulator [Gemmatimonadota bacterium]
MSPDFAVLSLSDSFVDLWPKLVPSAGARLISGASVTDLGRLDGLSGVLISAAGAETDAIPLIDELHARCATDVAVTGVETDYRVAISLLRAGACGYYALPDDLGMLRSWMVERVEHVLAAANARELAAAQRERYDFSRLLGRSPVLLAALGRAAKVIPRPGATVLITGETGTGKELLARAIHYNGPRAPKPFVEINCTALPENLLEAELFGYEAGAFTDAKTPKPGLLEAADGGTLFLDEIGDLSLNLQGKLLRVIEERRVRRLGSVRDHEVDVRIVAATHVNLAAAVQEKRFRQDLYYRLNVVPLELPALRNRGDDILVLATHFLERFGVEYQVPHLTLTPDIRRVLLAHSWPGNVRELRNAIERAVLLGDGDLDVTELFAGQNVTPAPATAAIPFPAPMSRIEQAAARAMTDWCGGNKSQAAKALGISRKHLYSLLSQTE